MADRYRTAFYLYVVSFAVATTFFIERHHAIALGIVLVAWVGLTAWARRKKDDAS